MAALIYPLARRSGHTGKHGRLEVAAAAAFSAVGLIAAYSRHSKGPEIVAAAWVAHALFDATHPHDDGSALPEWYPAACAGFDIAIAALLLRPTD